MNTYAGNFVPQQQDMQQQSPVMAPQQPGYRQQMGAALASRQAPINYGMPDISSLMKMMQLMKDNQQPTTPPVPASVPSPSSFADPTMGGV